MAITDLEMADLVREVCYDMGAGPLVLGGPLSGYRAFADAVSAGARFPYVIVSVADPAQWEAGTAVLDESGRLARTPAASSAGGEAVDFGAGEKRVGLALHSGWVDAVEAHGHAIAGVSGLAAALADKQEANPNLTAIAGQASAADQLSYWTGAGTAGMTALRPVGRALIGAADAGAARAGLGLAIGSDVQAHDADLDAIAALATTAFGRGALTTADAAAFRSYIGAGTSSTTGTVTSVAASGGTSGLTVSGGPITGAGTLTLGGTLALANGGTGATGAAAARANLGLAIGSDVQAYSASLAGYAAGPVPTSYSTTLLSTPTSTVSFQTAIGLGTTASPNFAGLVLSQQGASTNTSFIMNGDAGWSKNWLVRVGNLNRWQLSSNNVAESGSNAGSDLTITRYNDAGAAVAVALQIMRSSGDMIFGGLFRPATDNAFDMGTASFRVKQYYGVNATISTSDQREKQAVGPIGDAVLDAWDQVNWVRFKWDDAVLEKGEEGARWHFGLIAQHVREMIDEAMGPGSAVRLGLVCYDQWDAADAVMVPEIAPAPVVIGQDADGADIVEERDVPTGRMIEASPARAAGDRWGLRYDECFALEAAWQRRRLARIEARLDATEAQDVAG